MSSEPVKKNDIVCAFHSDLEHDVCRMKRRLDILILITIINALLTGAQVILKLPSVFS